MDPFDWIDKRTVKLVTGGIIIGLIASSHRAFKEKDAPRAFVIRLILGGSMAGVVAWLLSDYEMPKIVYGIVIWASGWTSSEVGALLAKGGKQKIESAIGIEGEKTEGDESKSVG